jgi:probable HAF family extracellular repeat protein
MAVVLCVWSLPTLSRAASYSFTTIDRPGATDTYLYGINDIGGIVGGFPGFQYKNGVFTDIPAPRPLDINNAGQIVGEYSTINGNAAFLYSGGVFTSLPLSAASGINDAGQIVGATQTIGNSQTPGETHGYLYINGTRTTIDFPGAGLTFPSSINNVGQIAGTFRYPGATGYIHGFVESNGVFTIVDEPGFVDAYLNGTIINGINDSGDMVGWIVKGSAGCSFVYHEGSFTCFSVPGALFTYAYGINNAGQIVGDYGFSVSAAHGFIATPIPESAAVPEPGALLLVAGGLVALVRIRVARRRTA